MEVLSDLLSRHAPVRPVAGCAPIVVHQAADVFALWQAWEEETGRRQDVPFWAVVWPAARVLARYVLERRVDVSGATVVDIGCGAGVVSIACALAGASSVVANDIDRTALAVAEKNAIANSARIRCIDRDLLVDPSGVSADVILVADFFYEKAASADALRVLRAASERGTRVIVADAGRPFSPVFGAVGPPGFSPGAPAPTMLREERVEVNRELEGVSERVVRVFELR